MTRSRRSTSLQPVRPERNIESLQRGAYSIFEIRVSIFWHFGHSKECNSQPGRSASIPNSNIAVPHLEHTGRLIELEYGVAGW